MKKLLFALFTIGIFIFMCGSAYADINSGLAAHWPLDGDANDIIGGNHGTVYGAIPTTDRFGNPNSAYHFDYQDYML